MAVAVAVSVGARDAWAQLRIVSYNNSGSNSGANSALSSVLSAIGDEQRVGIARPLDIISLQEQTIGLSSTQVVVNRLNTLYGAGTYAASTLSGGGDTTQSVVYNTNTVSLISQQAFLTTGTSGAPRQPLRFQFRPVGYESNADFYVYSAHPKSSNDTTSAARRGVEATGIRANADALGTGVRAIYTGDFNTYYASEAFIQTMIAAGGPGRAYDPINRLGDWSNNGSFADVHTQSPVVTSSAYYGSQVGGGMDDRFDFQLVTAPVISGRGLSYINGTYHAFGNAGNQFNNNINLSSSATLLMPYFPGYTQSQVLSVLNALAANSDHIPVVADYRLPAKMSVADVTPTVPGRVITGAQVNVSATIANTAPVMLAIAGDQLDYSATLTGSPTSAVTGTIAATGAAQTATLALETTTLGPRAATLNITSSSPGVANGASSTPYAYTVLAHATPSLTAGTQTTAGTLDIGVVAIGTTVDGGIAIHNLTDASGYTAALSITGGSLSGSPAIDVDLTSFTDIAPGTMQSADLSVTPTEFGALSAALSINSADELLPGAIARDTLSVSIAAFGAYAGDATLNNVVDFDDLLTLARNYNTAGGAIWQQGDFNRDGNVDFDDLLSLARRYGFDGQAMTPAFAMSPEAFAAEWALAQSLVPEPTMMLSVFALGGLAMRRRRAIV